MTFSNNKKNSFLTGFPSVAFNVDACNHASRCKFNFSYLDDSQKGARSFGDWGHEQIIRLLAKLREYGKFPLHYWQHQRCGAGGRTIFEIYDGFPKRSAFKPPKNVPLDARWARFRLEGDMRLAGFVIPTELVGKTSKTDGYLFDQNTFYVVFLDDKHQFYLTEK